MFLLLKILIKNFLNYHKYWAPYNIVVTQTILHIYMDINGLEKNLWRSIS